jgi:pyruvate kinase
MSRRAKIVCTLGPATSTAGQVTKLVEAGMDIARLNFSHGSHADHERSYRLVREAADSTGRAVGVLADLQGPKIRLGRFAPGLAVVWQPGDQVVITTEHVIGTVARVSTTYTELPSDVVPGNRLLVDDGNLALEVLAVHGPDVRCQVLEGGPVSDNKGLSVPGVALSVPALSDKDIADMRFAMWLRVDWVALSFVRSPDDAKQAREIMAEAGERLPLVAKLERPEAMDRLPEIVEAFDGIMVARGDLGVELPLERVPLAQKVAVQLARENSKPVIVATQMLDSMIDSFRPTRAEASDVANAVLDGADAVMLSGETSVGRYPVEAVRTMARIIETVNSSGVAEPPLLQPPRTTGGAISKAAKEVGETLGAKALCCFTVTGDTVRRMARFHSPLPLLAFTPEPTVRNQLALTWGVETFLAPYVAHTDEMVAQVQDYLLSLDRFETGDLVVIVAGSPPGTPGSTNALRVWRLGDEIPGTGEGDGSHGGR